MTCFRVRKRLIEYVEWERGSVVTERMSPNRLRAIEAHLNRCARCREEGDAIGDTLSAVSLVREVEPSAQFKLRTVAALRQEAEWLARPNPFALRLRLVLVSLVVLATVAGVIALLLPRQRVQPVELAKNTDQFEKQIGQYTREIDLLAGTLSGSQSEPTSYAERARLDKAMILANSIDECARALKRNPENERVKTVLLANMREEVDTLKSLYKERTL